MPDKLQALGTVQYGTRALNSLKTACETVVTYLGELGIPWFSHSRRRHELLAVKVAELYVLSFPTAAALAVRQM